MSILSNINVSREYKFPNKARRLGGRPARWIGPLVGGKWACWLTDKTHKANSLRFLSELALCEILVCLRTNPAAGLFPGKV